MILLGRGVFFLSVMTILCCPPSATLNLSRHITVCLVGPHLQRYMWRNDLPLLPHLVISTISVVSGHTPNWLREKISLPLISISKLSWKWEVGM